MLTMTVCPVVLLLLSGAVFGADAQDRFNSEYPAALAAIETQLSAIRFTATIERHGSSVSKTDFACGGRAFRVITVTQAAEREDQVGGEHVYMATRGGETFYLRKFPRTDEYVLVAQNIEYDAFTEFRAHLLPAFVPYCIETQRIADLMAEDEFRVIGVREVAVDSERGVRIDWQSAYLNPQAGRIRKSGWFTVLPARQWVLKEYELAFAQKDEPFRSWRRVVASYGKSAQGDPIVTAVEEWKEVGEERRRVPVASYRDVAMERNSVSDDEFSLSRFGLGAPAPRPWFRYMILGVVIPLSLALLFQYLARRLARRCTA